MWGLWNIPCVVFVSTNCWSPHLQPRLWCLADAPRARRNFHTRTERYTHSRRSVAAKDLTNKSMPSAFEYVKAIYNTLQHPTRCNNGNMVRFSAT